LKGKIEAKPKMASCLGLTYEVVVKGAELHDSHSFFGKLTEVTHIGVPMLIFDDGEYVVNANRVYYMERVA
tara:strand:- start:1 stop:213 length:213 start_codon:yes stop_codon:yes gene_type:complete